MRQFYIFDSTHNKLEVDKMRTCEVASKLRLYVGHNYCEEDIKKIWNYKSIYPSSSKIRHRVSIGNMKWFINSHTNKLISDLTWNADFLIGMLQWGKIYYYSRNFPSFIWYGNGRITSALALSPFAGSLSEKCDYDGTRLIWSKVPALCLKHSSDTVDYMAGVLSTGLVETYQNKVLAKYNSKVGKIIRRWGIPIEHQNKTWIYISPFWAVILQKYMPECLRKEWQIIPKAYRAQEYASILWKIYTGKDPIVNKMPYLQSIRTIFNKYGSVRALRDLWIKDHLVELDVRFKKVVQEWQAKTV